jgi:hypothetical protein
MERQDRGDESDRQEQRDDRVSEEILHGRLLGPRPYLKKKAGGPLASAQVGEAPGSGVRMGEAPIGETPMGETPIREARIKRVL